MRASTSAQQGAAWWQLETAASSVREGQRVHCCVEGRYITIFRVKGGLSAIDAICHHAGGPLTAGPLQEIEELGGVTVVLCPWHRCAVDVKFGLKAYQSVEIRGGAPLNAGWRIGKMVQRPHNVFQREHDDALFVQLVLSPDQEPCASDKDTYSERCAQSLSLCPVSGPYFNI
jgi:nitrite reductase/ring-hydroxylating ferredoxin subunit